ncbi:hypothetical protein ES705_31280 [subsurface metagenome]
MPRYRCSGAPDWLCEIHPLGEYPDFESCREACRYIDPETKKRGARSVFRKHPAGVQPGPMASEWWGCLADRVWMRQHRPRGLVSRPKIPHKTQKNKTPEQKCPCESFTMCDTYWQNMDSLRKHSWHHSVKNKPMSGYQLFMKECLCLLIAGYNFPVGPSPSGGFNCITVEPGSEKPPLEGFIGQAKVRYRCKGRPDWKCVPSPSGAYETLEACEAVCHLPYKWSCSGPPDWECYPEPEGTFETEAACLDYCQPQENTCNDCYPQIPDTLYGTLKDSGGGLIGDYTFEWYGGCTWINTVGEGPASISWTDFGGGTFFWSTIPLPWTFTEFTGNPCDPSGEYEPQFPTSGTFTVRF